VVSDTYTSDEGRGGKHGSLLGDVLHNLGTLARLGLADDGGPTVGNEIETT
jgi:hypothetical protein